MSEFSPHKPSWQSLTAIEPRLLGLIKIIEATEPAADEFWICWSSHKRVLCSLVGDDAAFPEIANHLAYDTAYQFCFNAYETRWGHLE